MEEKFKRIKVHVFPDFMDLLKSPPMEKKRPENFMKLLVSRYASRLQSTADHLEKLSDFLEERTYENHGDPRFAEIYTEAETSLQREMKALLMKAQKIIDICEELAERDNL